MFILFAKSFFASFPNLSKRDVKALYDHCSLQNEQKLLAELRVKRMQRTETKQEHVEPPPQDPSKFPFYRRLCKILLEQNWDKDENIINILLDSELDNYLKVELYLDYLNHLLKHEINPLPLFQQFFTLGAELYLSRPL